MASNTIPDIVIGRLPMYLRALTRMDNDGQVFTSSKELGEQLGISSAQIRKDISHFGEFGKQGTGYQIKLLQEKLRGILKVDREWPVALVGAGDLGRAIANYQGFRHRGFVISLVFDSDPAKIGQRVGAVLNRLLVLDVAHIVPLLRDSRIRVAMLAVPADAAQAVTDQLVLAGIRAILNYAPIHVNVPPHVRVQYIDPVAQLQWMTYYLNEGPTAG